MWLAGIVVIALHALSYLILLSTGKFTDKQSELQRDQKLFSGLNTLKNYKLLTILGSQ